jgi:hypothetical protein
VEETLGETKGDLELHCMVLDEHKETEERFHGQASKTLVTLEATLLDVEGLHQKIGTNSVGVFILLYLLHGIIRFLFHRPTKCFRTDECGKNRKSEERR